MKVIVGVLLVAGVALACTNFLVTPGASVDNSSMIAYAADSAALYGALYHNAHSTYENGTMLDIYEWDTGRYLGQIEQVAETYNTVGNTNEYGLAIGETTFGGLEALAAQDKAIMDYGSLIYITLQRAKTAREAIKVMTDLVAKYGYASEGESFSIADKNEVWVLEMIGKGNFELGAVWVARRVPDGHVTSHANQARITTFPRNDEENCVFSKDVVSFAKAHGFYPKDAKEENFSFSDVYNPVGFEGARLCELRVWSFFRRVVGAKELDPYTEYVRGKDLKNRMPWSFVPSKKLAPKDLMELLRDHYEDTVFDFTQDVGAGAFNLPYRWRPMTFDVDNKTYTNERSTGTQQTAFVFVAQLRKNMPDFLTAKNWFSVDDTGCAIYAPMYGSNTEIPEALLDKDHGAIMNFTLKSSFWVFNLVANLAYTRWRIIYPEVYGMITKIQNRFINESAVQEKAAKDLYDAGKVDEAVSYLSNYSRDAAQSLHDTWLDFWEYLVPRYLDGNVKTYVPGKQNPDVEWPGYGDAWYKRIVEETGDKYLIPDETSSSAHSSGASSPASRAVPGLPSLRRLLSFIHLW